MRSNNSMSSTNRKCVVCFDEFESGLVCGNCGESICFSCFIESDSLICSACHTHSYSFREAYDNLSPIDFNKFMLLRVSSSVEDGVKRKSTLKQIIKSFIDEHRLNKYSIAYAFAVYRNIFFALQGRQKTCIQIVKRVEAEERPFLKRFEAEMQSFIRDKDHIMLVPSHKVCITAKNKTMISFISHCEKFFAKYNFTLLDGFSFAVAHAQTTSLAKSMFANTRCVFEKLLPRANVGVAEGICSSCNNGILYRRGDVLLCSACSRSYCPNCMECLSYVNATASITAHTCNCEKKREFESLNEISTPCPFCGRRIQKVENTCNSMFCTYCKRGFDYITRVELKGEFHNAERAEWLSSLKREHSSNLSSQFRNFDVNDLRQLVMNYATANRESAAVRFISNSGLFYCWDQLNHFDIKRAKTSKKPIRHEWLLYEDELREFIYFYFEHTCLWFDISANDFEIANSLELIFSALDVLFRLHSFAPQSFSYTFEDSINNNVCNWLSSCEHSVEVAQALLPLRQHISFNINGRAKLRAMIQSLDVKYCELVSSSEFASLQIKLDGATRFVDVKSDEDGFAVCDAKRATRLTRGVVELSQFRISPRSKISFDELLKSWGL